MQHHVDAVARFAAGVRVGNVRLDEAVAPPRVRCDRGLDLDEVAPVAGREVVEADDVLVELEQRLDEV